MGEEEVVERRIRHTARDSHEEAESCAAVCNAERIKENADSRNREERQQNAEVGAAVRQHFRARAEEREHRAEKSPQKEREHRTNRERRHRDPCEPLPREQRLAFAERFRDERRAAGCEHDGEAIEEVDRGIDDVRRSERRRAGIAADEDAVRDGIEGDDEHHPDGRSREAQKAGRRESLRERRHTVLGCFHDKSFLS